MQPISFWQMFRCHLDSLVYWLTGDALIWLLGLVVDLAEIIEDLWEEYTEHPDYKAWDWANRSVD